MSKASRTYTLRMITVTVVYTAAVVGINLVDSALTLPQWGRVALSLLPVLPAIAMLLTMLSFVRAMDEVQRRIITESVLISAGVVGVACFTYGFIEGAMELPEISLIWVLPALIAGQGIAMIFVRMRYQ